MTNEEPLQSLAVAAARVKAEAEATTQFLGMKDVPSVAKIHVSLCSFAAYLVSAFPRSATKEPECYFLNTQNINSEGWPEEVIKVAWPLVNCYRGVVVGWKQFSCDVELKLQDDQTIEEQGWADFEKLVVQLVADMTDWLDTLLPGPTITASEPEARQSGESEGQEGLSVDGEDTPFVDEANEVTQESYLGIKISVERELTFQGKTCDFQNASKAFELTNFLYKRGNRGAKRLEIFDELYGKSSPRTEDALRKQKDKANEVLADVGLEIYATYGQKHMTLKPI